MSVRGRSHKWGLLLGTSGVHKIKIKDAPAYQIRTREQIYTVSVLESQQTKISGGSPLNQCLGVPGAW
jgi:hypothetical protein